MAEISRIDEAYCWNLTRLSEALGLHRDTIRKRLLAAGVVPVGTRKGASVYALKDVCPAVFADTVMGGELDPETLPPMEMRAWYQAQNERVKLDKELRRLVPAEEAHREMSTIAKAVTTTLESLPDILERDCGIDADSVARVQDIIDSMRQQLYERIIDDEPDE